MIRFVTGTDTGVGKTVTCAALAMWERGQGRTVQYFKPVQTGVEAGEPGDADFVASATGIPTHEGARFPAPLAPAVAARVAGEKVDVDALLDRARELAAGCDVLIVEGAGGLLVPLADRYDMADFAHAIDAELIVVTRASLGTLNHTALTLEAARRRALDGALVVCGWPALPDLTARTNLEMLSEMAPVLGLVPFVDGLNVEEGAAQSVPRMVSGEIRQSRARLSLPATRSAGASTPHPPSPTPRPRVPWPRVRPGSSGSTQG